MRIRSTVMRFTLLSGTVAISMVLAAGNGAYALGGPSGSGGRGYHPPLHGPGSSHNPIVKRWVHGPGSSHNPIVIRRRGRY
jgi:hypothetical protein